MDSSPGSHNEPKLLALFEAGARESRCRASDQERSALHTRLWQRRGLLPAWQAPGLLAVPSVPSPE